MMIIRKTTTPPMVNRKLLILHALRAGPVTYSADFLAKKQDVQPENLKIVDIAMVLGWTFQNGKRAGTDTDPETGTETGWG